MKNDVPGSENIQQCTDNYADHREAMAELSIVDIIRAYDYIALLGQFINSENEVLDDMQNIQAPLGAVIEKLLTDRQCPHSDCDRYLYKSDLPQYNYVCPACDENF